MQNPLTGSCLAVPGQTANTPVDATGCTFGPGQTWTLPAGPLIEGAGQLCLSSGSGSGTRVTTSACRFSTSANQLWTLRGDGTIASDSGQCLAATGAFSRTPVVLAPCNDNDALQLWTTGPDGELINFLSGRCLAGPNDAGPGTTVVQNDCYGEPGEIWGLN